MQVRDFLGLCMEDNTDDDDHDVNGINIMAFSFLHGEDSSHALPTQESQPTEKVSNKLLMVGDELMSHAQAQKNS